MAFNVGDIFVNIGVQMKDFYKGLSQAQKAAANASSGISDSLRVRTGFKNLDKETKRVADALKNVQSRAQTVNSAITNASGAARAGYAPVVRQLLQIQRASSSLGKDLRNLQHNMVDADESASSIGRLHSESRRLQSQLGALNKSLHSVSDSFRIRGIKHFNADMASVRASSAAMQKNIQTVSRQLEWDKGLVHWADKQRREMQRLEAQVGQSTSRIRKFLDDVGRISSGIIISQAFYEVTSATQGAIEALVLFNNEMQTSQVAFETLLGSVKEAKLFKQAVADMAVETPFDFAGVEMGAKRFMALGFSAEEVIPILRTVGDATAALGGDQSMLEGMALALGQIRTKGKVMSEELRQLAERGIPAYQILQEELGLTGEEVANIGDLAIDSNTAIAALLSGMEKRFGGLMERLENTTPGAFAAIRDNLLLLGNEFFLPVFQRVNEILVGIKDRLNDLRAILNSGGIGAVFEKVVPENMHTMVRGAVASIIELWNAIKALGVALEPVITAFGKAFIAALAIVGPMIAVVARVLEGIAWVAQRARGAIEFLVFAFLSMRIATFVAGTLVALRGAIIALAVSGPVAKLVQFLALSIRNLSKAFMKNPILGAIMLVATALIGLAMSSKTATRWLDTVMQRLYALMGMDVGGILQPKDDSSMEWIDKYNKDIGSVVDSMKGLGGSIGDIGGAGGKGDDPADKLKGTGKEAKKAKKEVDKFLASFDEVYAIPEKHDSGSGDGSGGSGGGLDDLTDGLGDLGGLGDLAEGLDMGDFKVPELGMPEDSPEDTFNDWWGGFNLEDFLFRSLKPLFNLPDIFNLPPPNGAVATAWVTTLNTIANAANWASGAIRWGFESVGNFLGGWVPSLNPVLGRIPVIVGNAVLGVRTALAQVPIIFGQALIPVAAFATNFRTFLSQLPTIASTVAQNVGKEITMMGVEFIIEHQAFFQNVSSQWEKFKEKVGSIVTVLTETVSYTFNWAWEGLKNSTEKLLEDMKNLWNEHRGVILTILTVIAGIIVTVLTGGLGGALAAAGRFLPNLLKVFGRISPGFKEAIKNLPSHMRNLGPAAKEAASWVVEKMIGAFARLPDGVKTAISNLPGILRTAVNKALGAVDDLFAWVGRGIDKIPGANNPFPNGIPGYANGGIVNDHIIAQLGEGGKREAVIPLQNNRAMAPFADAVASRMMQNMGGMSAQQNTPSQPTLYVHTLIADDRGLRELERRMRVVRMQENTRGV
jgi:tape measure domain-containing protein